MRLGVQLNQPQLKPTLGLVLTVLTSLIVSFLSFVHTPLERSGGLFTKTTGIINVTHSAVNVIEECFLSLMRSI